MKKHSLLLHVLIFASCVQAAVINPLPGIVSNFSDDGQKKGTMAIASLVPSINYTFFPAGGWTSFRVSSTRTNPWYSVLVFVCAYSSDVKVYLQVGSGAKILMGVAPSYYYCTTTGYGPLSSHILRKNISVSATSDTVINVSISSVSSSVACFAQILFLDPTSPPAGVQNVVPGTVLARDYDADTFYTSTFQRESDSNSTYRYPNVVRLRRVDNDDWLQLGSQHYVGMSVFCASDQLFRVSVETKLTKNTAMTFSLDLIDGSKAYEMVYLSNGHGFNNQTLKILLALKQGWNRFRLVSGTGDVLFRALHFTAEQPSFLTPRAVPGPIEATHFAFPGWRTTGTDVVLYSNSMVYRSDSKVQLYWIGGLRYTMRLYGTHWATYEFISPAGNFELAFAACATYSSSSVIRLKATLDGVVISDPAVPYSSSCVSNAYYPELSPSSPLTLNSLSQGNHTLRLEAVGQHYYSILLGFIAIVKQRGPFANLPVPGTISAAQFDEGFSFSKSGLYSPFVLFQGGNSTWRPNSPLPIFDGWNETRFVQLYSTEFLTFTLNVTISALYNLTFELVNYQYVTAKLLLNNDALSVQSFSTPYRAKTSAVISFVPLFAGQTTTLKVSCLSGSFLLGNITFTSGQLISRPTIGVKFIPSVISFCDFDSGTDSVAGNQGNSTYRLDSSVDVAHVPMAPSLPNVSVTNIDSNEVLRYRVRSPFSAVYQLSATIGNFYSSSGALASIRVVLNSTHVHNPSWTLFGATYYTQQVRASWNVSLMELFLPEGETMLEFGFTSLSSLAWPSLVFLHNFALFPLRVPFVPPMNLSGGGLLEAENFESYLNSSGEISSIHMLGNYSSYRAQQHATIFTNGGRVFIRAPKSSDPKLLYPVFVPAVPSQSYRFLGSYFLNSTGYLSLSCSIGAWTSATFSSISSWTVTGFGAPGRWTSETLSLYMSNVVPGWYELYCTLSSPLTVAYLDHYLILPSSGPYLGELQYVPGTSIMAWKFDYDSYYDQSYTNEGSSNVRHGEGVDLSLDTNGIPTIVFIQQYEYVSYSVLVTESDNYDFYFNGEAIGPVRCYFYVDQSASGGSWVFAHTTMRDYLVTTLFLSAGRHQFRLEFTSSNLVSFLSLRVSVSAPVSTPFRSYPITSSKISAVDYDYGPKGIAYQTTSVTSSSNVRSGSPFAFYGASNLYFNQAGATWVRYTFTPSWDGITRIYASGRKAYSNKPYQLLALLDNSIPPNVIFNASFNFSTTFAEVEVATASLLSSISYVLELRMEGDSYIIFNGFLFDSTASAILSPTCYSFTELQELPSSSRCTLTTEQYQCTLDTGVTTFPNQMSSTFQHCGFQEPGTPLVIAAPSQGSIGAFVAAHVQVVVESPVLVSDVIRNSKTWPVGSDVLSNGVAKVYLTSAGLMMMQLRSGAQQTPITIFGRVHYCPSPITGFRFQDGKIELLAGTCVANVRYDPSCHQLYLKKCKMYLAPVSPEGIDSYASYYVPSFGADCYNVTASFADKVEAVYSSGRVEKLGSLVVNDPLVPVGSVSFWPFGMGKPASSTSNCKNQSGRLKVVVVKFHPIGSEKLAGLRFFSWNNILRIGVGGVGWIKDLTGCNTPFFLVSPSITSISVGLKLLFTDYLFGATYFSSIDPRKCAELCDATASCVMFYMTLTSTTSSTCATTSSFMLPQVDLSTAQTSFVGVRSTASQSFTVAVPPSLERQLLHRDTDFPQSAGWSALVVLVHAGETTTVAITNVTQFALTVSKAHFIDSNDWVAVVAPGFLKQCGPSFQSFDDDAISTAGTCSSLSFGTCGCLSYQTPQSGSFSVIASAALGRSGCGTQSPIVLFVRGAINPPEPPYRSFIYSYASVYDSNSVSVTPYNLGGSSSYFVRYHPSTPLASLPSRNPFACTFTFATGYARVGVGLRSLNSVCMIQYRNMSLTSIILLCDGEVACLGYSTRLEAGVELPECLAYSFSSTIASGAVFYSKQRPPSFTCEHVALDTMTHLALSVTLTDLELPENFVTLSINGQLIGQCGGMYGFADGTKRAHNMCGSVATCFSGPVFVQRGDIIRLSLAERVTNGGLCAYALIALFTPSNIGNLWDALRSPPGFTVRRMYFPSASQRSFTLRFDEVEQIGLFIQDRRDYYESTNPMRFTVRYNGVGLQREYNFSCGQQLRSSDGYLYTCKAFHLCTTVSNGSIHSLSSLFETLSPRSSGKLDISYVGSTAKDGVTGACNLNYESGILFVKGRSVLTQLTENRMRILFLVLSNESTAQLATRFNISSLEIIRFPEVLQQKAFLRTMRTNSYNMTLFDIASVDESDKRWSSVTPRFACVVDSFLSTMGTKLCRLNISNANYVTVLVAQTHFMDLRFSVSVLIGGTSKVTCGGGRPFFGGTSGRGGACNEYLPCFQGSVPPGATFVDIIFSSPVTDVACFPAAIAVILPLNISFDSSRCVAEELVCYRDSTCIPAKRVCDGRVDCSDGSDEVYCSSWRLLSRKSRVKCATQLSVPVSGSLSFDLCKARAIIYALRHEALGSMSVLFAENAECTVNLCMSSANINDYMVTDNNVTGYLYVRSEVLSDVAACTNELSCNSRGIITSQVPPCRCRCNQGYLGGNCEIRKDMTAIADITMEFNATLGTAALLIVKEQIEVRLRVGGLDNAVVTVSEMKSSAAQSQSHHMAELAAGESYYSASVSSEGSSSHQRSKALALVLGQNEAGDLRAAIEQATNVKVLDVGSLTQIQLSATVVCNFSFTSSGTVYCNGSTVRLRAITVSGTKFTLVDYTATFYGALQDWTPMVDADDTSCTETVISNSYCPSYKTCYRQVVTESSLVYFQPRLVYSGSVSPVPNFQPCEYYSGSSSAVLMTMEYVYAATVPPSRAKVGDAVGVSTYRTSAGSQSLTGIIVICVLTFVVIIIAVTCYRRNNRFTTAFFSSLVSVGFMGIIILVGMYFDSLRNDPTHQLFVFEYRSSLCSNSSISAMPHRVSRVMANGQCFRVEVRGTSEGSGYMKAECGVGGKYTGTIRIAFNRTMASCESSSYVTFRWKTCYNESKWVPYKPNDQLQFIDVACYPSADADALMKLIQADFKPNIVLSDTTTTTPLSDEYRVNGRPNIDAFYRGSRLYSEQHAVGFSKASLTFASFATNSTFGDSSSSGSVEVAWRDQDKMYSPSEIRSGNMGNVSLLFSATDSSQYSSNSLRYLGFASTEFNFAKSDFTLTFWMRLSTESRGFIFAATDNWYNRLDQSSPIIEKILEIFENGLGEKSFFENTWSMYAGLYADGAAGTLNLIFASPSDGGGRYVELIWNSAHHNVQAQNIFDGNWHFIALGFSFNAGWRFAQLFVDGRTSYVQQGWRACFPSGTYLRSVSTLPREVPIQNMFEEAVTQGGVLYVGHLNGAVYGLQTHVGFVEQEKIIGFGASGMRRFASINITNSLLLGKVLGIISAIGLLLSLLLLVYGIYSTRVRRNVAAEQRRKEMDDEKAQLDQEELEEKRGNAGGNAGGNVASEMHTGCKGISVSAPSVALGTGTRIKTLTAGNLPTISATQLRLMIPAILAVGQTMVLFFQGWKWPKMFEINVNWAVFWLSFDVNLSFPDIPPLVSPALQLFLAVGVLMLMLAILSTDQESFEAKLRRIGGLPVPINVPKISLSFKLKVLSKVKGKSEYEVSPQSVDLFRSLVVKMLNSRAETHFYDVHLVGGQRPINMTVHVERNRGNFVLIAASNDGSSEWMVQSDEVFGPTHPVSSLIEFSITMETPHKSSCPVHLDTLIPMISSLHGALPQGSYKCTYHAKIGRAYRLVMDKEVKLCPRLVGSKGFVCQSDGCGYCVCDECFEGGMFDKVFANVARALYQVRTVGSLQILGFVVLTLAQAVHMPIMKNALMIIYCHVNYQCEFPDCYKTPTSSFLIFVAFAILISLAMGVGLVFFLFQTVIRRKLSIISIFNQQHLHLPVATRGKPPCQGSGMFARMDPERWDNILEEDNSMMKNLYEPYTFRYMWIHPMMLLFKLATVLSIVFSEPNSLTQLSLASLAEVVQLVFFIVLHPFLDHWIGFLTNFSSVHQVGQLCLMSFHRVAIFENPIDETFAMYMIYLSVAYVVVLIGIIVFALIIPAVMASHQRSKALESFKKSAIEDEIGGKEDYVVPSATTKRQSVNSHHLSVLESSSRPARTPSPLVWQPPKSSTPNVQVQPADSTPFSPDTNDPPPPVTAW